MRTTSLLAVATLIVLAGCTGSVPGGVADTTEADGSSLHVYVSDDPGAIDRFEHVNVTITQLSVRSATAPDEHDDDGRHRHRHRGNWTSYDLNATTVDLTELRGANASLLHAVGVPAGEYDAVSVTVADVNATLEGGESADVVLPDERLTVRKPFTVGGDESTAFVVDAVVRERDGGYVLVPNVERSGTDVELRPRGDCDCCHGHGSGGNETHHGGGWSHHGDHSGTDTHHGSGENCR
ncbi:hypothetical protein JCM30237_28360 [Halolamina litorea]|uniref:DUF4382 domain-containing protein n=1 Tax=Halolamina litorea TaxID=1515593 RepID=A0ABD6BST5_9EURY|nr:DUF4382 domain-containing protein [Halolamina litorea]